MLEINVRDKLSYLYQRKYLAFFLIIVSVLLFLFKQTSASYLFFSVALLVLLSKRFLNAFKFAYSTVINVAISLITLFFIFFLISLIVVYFFT